MVTECSGLPYRVLSPDFQCQEMESVKPTNAFRAGFTPLVQKPRPRTSLPLHHQSFAASPRIRSAVLTMPRSHVSIARFYDWSEDLGECVSVSKFYRDLAVASQRQDKVKARNKFCSNGTHMNPGRMFLRDKAGLTKGEREIIEGIYRNRGDLPKEPENPKSYSFKDEWDFVRSHKDAWMIGKQLQKQGFKFDPSLHLKVPEYLFSRLHDDESSTPREFCKMCENNRLNETNLDDSGFCVHWKGKYPTAPPTTPDADAGEFDFPENVPIKKKSTPRVRSEQERQISEQRIRVVKSVDESLLSRGSRDKADRKKVFVNVFLPRIPIDSAHAYSSSVVTDNKVHNLMADYSRNSSASRLSKVRRDPGSFVNSLYVTNSPPHNADSD